MYYYKGASNRQNQNKEKNKINLGNKILYFSIALSGTIIGIVIFSCASYYLSNTGNNTVGPSTKLPQPKILDNVSQTSTINSVEKQKDLPDMIESAKQTIVGVINMQINVNPFITEQANSNQEISAGSGIIYKKSESKAYILTNNHVVENANKLVAKLNNGKRIDAKLIKKDPSLDLAILEIDGSNISRTATLGDSNKIRTGESVIAIGNPLGLEGSVTKGIISNKNREIPVGIHDNNQTHKKIQVIQTDTSINPGNSGGALFNENGEVIGINSSKIIQKAVEKIGFAIPINTVKAFIESLKD